MKPCRYCGKPYAATRKRRIYCSEQCGKNSRNKKWRDAKDMGAYFRGYRYGFVSGEFERRILEQKGLCLACGRPFGDETPCIDHDHACCDKAAPTCGKCTRGLVHQVCNRILGQANDDATLLASLISYLREEPWRK